MKIVFSWKSIVPSAVIAIFIMAFLSTNATQAQANTSQNITMSPASTLLSVKPGETVEKSFEILNSGGDSYSIVTEAAPYHVSGLDYTPGFTQLPGTTDTASWIKITHAQTTVGPQKSADISYSVTVPEGTAPGGYYAVLFAETRAMNTSEKSGVVPRNRVGNILYITVEGDIKTGGTVKAEQVAGFQYKTSIPVGFQIANTGGVHFQSTENVNIKNLSGKDVYSAKIERYILPQTTRNIPINWSPSSPVGVYTVSRSAIVAGETRTLPDEKFVYIQPWVFVTLIILIVCIIIFFKTQASNRRKSETDKPVKNKKG